MYYSLFSHLNDGFAYCQVLFDDGGNPTDFVFCDLNKAFRRLTKLCDRPIIGKRATEVYPWLKDHSDWIKVGKVAQTEKRLMIEGHCKPLDRWYSVNAYCPQKGYLAMIINDITGRKKTEQTLRQSEKQFKKLANSITDPFFALDSSLKFNYWNKASEKFTGISSAEVVGKHFFEVVGNQATRKVAGVYLDVMRKKNHRTLVDRLPRAVNGTVFETEIYPTGNGISVLAKDITERKKRQVTLEEYTKQLEDLVRIRTEKLKNSERLAAIGETAGMIGHDIRNPLQSIIGELYLAKDELGELPETETRTSLLEGINAIEEQVIYINKIVTDLQDFAKPLTPAFQDVALEEIIQNAIIDLCIPSNIKIGYSILKPLPLLKTDYSFMKRILSNLIRNGVQAMEEMGGELVVNAFPREGSVIIAISDTGAGIPDSVKQQIKFHTKSRSRFSG